MTAVPEWLKHPVRHLRSSPFGSNFAQLTGATAVGGVIAIAASPLITRLYTPSEFGSLGVFATILSLVTVVASLRYDLGIPYPKDDGEAASVLALALLIVVLTSLSCTLVILLGLPHFVPGLEATLLGRLIWWLPVGMCASASYAALSIWMIRRRDFAAIGTTKITQGALQAGSQVVFGIFHVGAFGLIVGQIVGSSAGLLRLWRQIRRQDWHMFESMSRRRLVATARAYRRFPVLSTPAALLDSATGAMPLLFIAAQFGPTAAGLLTLVQRVLTVPFGLLTVNLGQLVFGDLAELRRSEPASLMPVFRRRLLQIAVTGLVLILPLVFILPLLLPRVFGDRWADASLYFVILSPMTYAGFVSSPFGFVIDVLRRQDLHLLRESVRAVVMGLALAGSAQLHTSWSATLVVMTVAGVINGAFYLSVSWYAISSHATTAIGSSVADLDTNAFVESS